MAKKFGTSSRGSRFRTLHCDPLEQRALLAVTTFAESFAANENLGFDLAALNYQYRQFMDTNTDPAAVFQAKNPYLRVGGGHVAVTAVAENGDTAALYNQLAGLGLKYGAAAGAMVEGLLPLSSLEAMAGLSTLAFARPSVALTHVGSTTSQADETLRAVQARSEFSVDGSGITVGVMSDSFDALGGALGDVASGDLPPLEDIDVVLDLPSLDQAGFGLGSDEGRAMMQLIYDVSPGASQAFRTATITQLDMAQGVRELANEAGSDVIVDDILWLFEPMFQDGFIAQAVDEVVGQGVSYFSSAGNSGSESYEAPFSPDLRLPAGEFDSDDNVPDFLGGRMHARTFLIPEMPENFEINLIMQWDQPFFSVSPGSGGSANDYDMYLFDADFDPAELDGTVVAASVNSNLGGDPVEWLTYLNEDHADEDHYLVIVKRLSERRNTVASTNVPLAIPDNGNTATSTLDYQVAGVPANVTITDVNVTVNINHTAVGQLALSLVSPNGTVVDLVAQVGGTGNNFTGTVFDDEAGQTIDAGNAPFTGRFQPQNDLADFIGEIAQGQWQLLITDSVTGDIGTLTSWSLDLGLDFDPTPDASPLKIVNFGNSVPGISGASTVYGHANAAGASAVGAVLYTDAPLFYGNPLVPEPFSSVGGTDILFDTAGTRLGTPVDRMKPNIMAPDGTNTTFFPFLGFLASNDVEPDGFPNFFGTSAAAPHAAAVAALMKQVLPTATPADIYAAMEESAYDMVSPGYDVISGNGYMLADEAIRTLVLNHRGSIEGTVFNDEDGDRVQSPGEAGLPDWTVFLDFNQNETLDEISRRFDAIQTEIDLPDALSVVNLPTTTTTSMLVYGVPTVDWNDLSVEIDVEHSAVGNLEIVLISPSGTRILLVDQRGALLDNFNKTVFNDLAATSIVDGTAPYTGEFRPEEALSALMGEEANGRWTLEITDHTPFNTGVLNNWALTFDFDEPSAVTDADGNYVFNNLLFGNYTAATVLEPDFQQTTPTGPSRRPIVVSEIDMRGVDKLEIQNVDLDGGPVDTSGWFVAISDAPFPDINQANTTIWQLPDTMQPGEVLYRTDSPADNYFGTNIFWNSDNSRIGSGWVMVVDDLGNVIDWVGWGWTEDEIDSFNVTVGGFTIDNLDGLWTGAGIDRAGPGTLQRTGSLDTNTSADFVWHVSQSVGAQNVLAGIQLPIVSPTSSSNRTVRFVNQNVTDVDFGNRAVAAAPVVNNQPNDPGQSNNETPDPPGNDPSQNEEQPGDNDPPSGNNSLVQSGVGLFDAVGSVFFLRDENAPGPANNVVPFGPASAGWIPLAGDWDGNGSVTVGLYDPQTSTFYLRNANLAGAADVVFQFGPAGGGWKPLVGDWNGDGVDTVGLYSGEVFFLSNANAAGTAEVMFGFGPAQSGWTPLVGDWNGDGTDTVGFHDGENFFLRNVHEGGLADTVFAFGPAGAGWKPVVGDWGGSGYDGVALYSGDAFFLRQTHAAGPADQMFAYGPAQGGWTPMAGRWQGLGGAALKLAGGAVNDTAESLTRAQLDAAIGVSVGQWQAAGLTAAQREALQAVEFRIADLPGDHLGLALPGVLYIDSDAAGRGWNTDLGSDALDAARVDLLSVVGHELGHALGLDDLAEPGGLMHDTLATGERHVPTVDDVDRLFAGGLWE